MQHFSKPVAAICLAVASAFVQAQQATYDFNIPAQPVGQVLDALAKQTDLQPFYAEGTVKGAQSPGVKGKLSLREALDKALAGTGLTYQFTGEKAVANYFDSTRANVFTKSRMQDSGLYVQDQMSLSDDWEVLLGGRYDVAKDGGVLVMGTTSAACFPNCTGTSNPNYPTDRHFSPRAAVLYKVAKNVSVYGSYSKSFDNTNLTSRSFDHSAFSPQTGVQFELGAKANPSKATGCGDTCPVENVSWNEVQDFLRRLSARTGKTYRLPSEAEWEYACRAASTGVFCGGDQRDKLAWFGKAGTPPHPVGQKAANAWGLHDMNGNVWEWVQDCAFPDYSGAPADGTAWTEPGCKSRVVRGGSWWGKASTRLGLTPDFRAADIGFRVVREEANP